MKLTSLTASRYRSLRDLSIPFGDLNVFIGPNAAGKSNVLDALRFMHEGVREKDFAPAASFRGGIVHLAWKGEAASEVQLSATFDDGGRTYTWRVILERVRHDFSVHETVHAHDVHQTSAPQQLLESRGGKGWWWSSGAQKKVKLSIDPTACALSAASVDESFPARGLTSFVREWGFFDPSPPLLRGASSSSESDRLDPNGKNLAARLQAIQKADPALFERIITATRSVLGVPSSIEFRESGAPRRYDAAGPPVYFVQEEPGLDFKVSQAGASSGTLRTLAFMTALFGQTASRLVAIEEPENHIHPAALEALAEHLKSASAQVQVMVTTHSPLLLDCLDTPEAVYLVRRGQAGTEVSREPNPNAIREALVQSRFGLGEFYEARGFGG